ncbi:uncharacterized protein RAG0_13069 [Rhynchosporium agropyri]|uniref:Uncharacterized protein n=1 Tax=Rhynchosporium agropyri TaxID=914238 RepID=A0A1E1LB05_9HELO|nr:uncharacterized protein RAG0_13069 [Rhynchosporium agropyri]
MATIAKPTNVTNNQVTIVSATLITFHCEIMLNIVNIYPAGSLLRLQNSPVFHLGRQNVEEFLNSTPRILGSPFTKHSAHANITDVVSSSMSIRQTSLTLPGPQLLAFLDHQGQVMSTKYKQMVTLGGKGEKATLWFYAPKHVEPRKSLLPELTGPPQKRRRLRQKKFLDVIMNSTWQLLMNENRTRS